MHGQYVSARYEVSLEGNMCMYICMYGYVCVCVPKIHSECNNNNSDGLGVWNKEYLGHSFVHSLLGFETRLLCEVLRGACYVLR